MTRDDKPIDIRQTCRAGVDSRDAKRVSQHIKTFAEAPANMTADIAEDRLLERIEHGPR